MKTKLTIEVEFDGEQTDAESLASATDVLLRTALSTTGVLEEYGNPQFGTFDVEASESSLRRFEQQFGIEDTCPKSRGGHEPDWSSAHVDYDGESYVDVVCKHCGRSGCIGSEETLTDQISW